MTSHIEVPIVLCCSGNDPTGGAGIQADIEAVTSQGCHAAPAITCLTVQDTHDVKRVQPIDTSLFIEQVRAVLEDMPVSVIKLGLLGSVEICEAIHTILTDYPDIPVVLDPILASGGGNRPLADQELTETISNMLLPQTTIITPNSREALKLAPDADNNHSAAIALLDRGCEYVLITGADSHTEHVHNTLYHHNHTQLENFSWPRLAASYHGSGCTLAASIAGLLAQDHEMVSAVRQAQEYTWQALDAGYRLGMGQLIPNRFFWAGAEVIEMDEEDDEAES